MYGSAPTDNFSRELAAHLDRVRRQSAPLRPSVVMHNLRRGWAMASPGQPPGEVPSASRDRAFWLTADAPPTTQDLNEALAFFREHGRTRAYIWVAPWAWNAQAEGEFVAARAAKWPWVEYIALARPAVVIPADAVPAMPTSIVARPLLREEVADVLGRIQHWYSEDGARAALAMAREGAAQVHAAFDGDAPVAMGLVSIDGAWGYLSAAGTDPAHRGRGAQTALIRSRVASAANSGAAWCSCETNTMVPISLANLRRCGFVDTITWRVFGWDVTEQGQL